jgi:cytochrome c oxidase cbb3-type subunit III
VRIPLILAALTCLVAVVLLQQSRIEARLLRADPTLLPTDPELMAFAQRDGDARYASYCATCHGASGGGDPERGIPSLSDGDWLYGTGSLSDIEQIIKYGIRSQHPKAWSLAVMPAYGTPQPSSRDGKIPPLSPGNIHDLVEFLIHEQGRHADAEAAARGASLFRGAAGCYDCHAQDAKGDAAIGAPNLVDGITLYGDASREALNMSIAYGRQGVCPSWVSRLSPVEVCELAAYVYSLSHFGAR